MSTEQIWEIESTSLENTLNIAAQIGQRLRGGEVIELVSDLGGGKTAFVKGLAKGMGSLDVVRSPSFTISNQYKAKDLILYHFDFYRLSEAGIIKDELAEIITDPKTVVVIEWASIAVSVIPDQHVTINIKVVDEEKRKLIFSYDDKFRYLFPINT